MVLNDKVYGFVSLSLSLSVIFQAVLCDGGNDNRVSQLPLWQSLLIHHRKWSGYYVHNENRFTCSMNVHSVQYDDQGVALISFISNNIQIEMTGLSDDNRVVVFQENHSWNKSGHFKDQTDLIFNGSFIPDVSYYKYEATVSSKETKNYGIVTLIPQGTSVKLHKHDNKNLSLGLAIGIPLCLGIVILILAVLIIIWSVRKGYLRHVPWSYKTFRNSLKKSDLEMNGENQQPQQQQPPPPPPQPTQVVGIETTAVHI